MTAQSTKNVSYNEEETIMEVFEMEEKSKTSPFEWAVIGCSGIASLAAYYGLRRGIQAYVVRKRENEEIRWALLRFARYGSL